MRNTFKENNVNYFPLFTTAEIFNIALEEQSIDSHIFESVMKFLNTFNS